MISLREITEVDCMTTAATLRQMAAEIARVKSRIHMTVPPFSKEYESVSYQGLFEGN